MQITQAQPNIYAYTRFSTGEQRKGSGKRRQDSGSQKWCVDKGWRLTKHFDDLGVSAFKGRNATHGELAGFLDAVRAGRIPTGSYLLVESLDRLSRNNINKALELFLSIINAGVIVVTIIDGGEYKADSDPHHLMSQMMISLAIFLRANDESRTKSLRKAASWKYKREAVKTGKYHGGRLPFWIGLDADGKYFIIEREADKVREFFRRFNLGEGLYLLSKKLGLPKSTLTEWTNTKTPYGTLTMSEEGKRVDYPGHYPAIIDRLTWETARRKKQERLTGGHRGRATFINLFQGLLFAPNGKTLIISSPNGPEHRMFVAEKCCLPVEYLESHLCWNHFYSSLIERHTTIEETPEDSARIGAIDKKIAQLQDAISADDSIVADLVPVLAKLRKERDLISSRAHKVVSEKADTHGVDNCLYKFSYDYQNETRIRLREIIRDSVERIQIERVEGTRRRLISGYILFTSGEKREFAYATHVGRFGLVSCDGYGDDPRQSKLIKYETGKQVIPLMAVNLNNEVYAELAKLPKISDVAKLHKKIKSSAA